MERKNCGKLSNAQGDVLLGEDSDLEPRRPLDPLRPLEPPSPFRPPGQYVGPRDDEAARVLREILDRLTAIENRLKTIEDHLRTRR